MSGFTVSFGYVGYIGGKWMVFATETEYFEYLEENE